LVYLRLERSNVGATCTVNGTVTLNGTEIPVTAVFASEDATLSTVVDDVYGKPYWLIFGN
ncbi:MAG TPA: hypothetical protein DER56_07215, partial [Thermosipho africanus]|nr:hypothetical protein [Thermosipho africanus]